MSHGKRAKDGPDRSRALPGEGRPVSVPGTKWRAALPDDAWPTGFPKGGHVWRQDVFDVTERWRAGRATARQLLAATLMWTYGEESAGRRRALRALEADPDGELIESALAPLRGVRPTMLDLRTAYLALRTTARLPELDPDTCTRLLYFAGYRRGGSGVRPLILDEFIVRRIPRAAEVTSPASRGSSLEWVRYIAWAAAQAGPDEEPDRVEMDLAAGGARYGEGRSALKSLEARGRHARR